MSINNFELQVQALPEQPTLHFYLVLDAAQGSGFLAKVREALPDSRSRCLLPFDYGPKLEDAAPHLFALPPFGLDMPIWRSVFGNGPVTPAALSIIASPLNFEALYARLNSFTEIVLPDGSEMIFAFWDPAILGTLVGQPDDTTLHVPGAVLSARENDRFMDGIAAWWYWDRAGGLHQIRPAGSRDAGSSVVLPLRLSQVQVDMLVEASMPDHILGHIRATKPELLAKIPERQKYPRIREYLLEAYGLRLRGMRDILDYVSAALIYGDRMHESSVIEALLEKVKIRQISLTQALERFP